MSTELKNINETVMDKIHDGQLKMRPKIYFIAGSVFVFVSLVSSMIFSVFLFGLIRFSLRSHGPMGSYRLDQILSTFPWWSLFLAIVGLILGVYLIRRYSFSYKLDFKILVIGFVLAVIAAGWLVDVIGLNDIWFRHGPMRGFMRQYYQETI